MLFFLQTSIPEITHLEESLQNVYGVGEHTSKLCLKTHGLLNSVRGKELRRYHRTHLKRILHHFPRILGRDLKQNNKESCQRLIDNNCYRGVRHRLGYPVRGQRTRTNASIQKRLHKRWLINIYAKPSKSAAAIKKKKPVIKKKPKVSTKQPSTKKKPVATKKSKYKV